MKKYFFLAAAALVAMCACTKTIVNEAPEVDQEITFRAATYSPATKATTDGSNAFLQTGNTSFGVYAYYNTVDWNSESAVLNVYMNNVEISHGGTDDNDDWAPAAKYYWPKTGKLTFVGWAPYANTPTYSKADGYTWTNYAVTPAPGDANKVDLMYADVAADKTANESIYGHTGVPMLFRHALAKLNFQLEYDMTGLTDDQKGFFEVQVTDITLKTLGNTATYTQEAWDTPSASADQELASTSNKLTSTSATQTDYVENYFIIPQTPVKLVVNYKINDIACNAVTLDLKTDSITAWAKNAVYTYNLKISPISDTPITFDPAVFEWVVKDPENINVK